MNSRTLTESEKEEIQKLYRRLAKHWNWPLPDTWIGDREVIVTNVDDALVCLRALVAEQCPLPYAGPHWADTPECQARSAAMKLEAA